LQRATGEASAVGSGEKNALFDRGDDAMANLYNLHTDVMASFLY